MVTAVLHDTKWPSGVFSLTEKASSGSVVLRAAVVPGSIPGFGLYFAFPLGASGLTEGSLVHRVRRKIGLDLRVSGPGR